MPGVPRAKLGGRHIEERLELASEGIVILEAEVHRHGLERVPVVNHRLGADHPVPLQPVFGTDRKGLLKLIFELSL